MIHRFLQTIWRVPFSLLFLFEVLALLHVFPRQPQFTILGLMLTSAFVFALLEWLHARLNKKHGQSVLWWASIPLIVALYLDAGGDFLYWYAKFPYYDAALHFFTSFAAAVYLWNYLAVVLRGKTSRSLRVLLSVTSITTLGAFYEMEEYLEDLFTGSHRLGDGFDTANDMLMNFLGASLVLLFIFLGRFLKRR